MRRALGLIGCVACVAGVARCAEAQAPAARVDSLTFTWKNVGFDMGIARVRIDGRGRYEVEPSIHRDDWRAGNGRIDVSDLDLMVAAIRRFPSSSDTSCAIVATDHDNLTIRLVLSDATLQFVYYTGCFEYKTPGAAARGATLNGWGEWASAIARRVSVPREHATVVEPSAPKITFDSVRLERRCDSQCVSYDLTMRATGSGRYSLNSGRDSGMVVEQQVSLMSLQRLDQQLTLAEFLNLPSKIEVSSYCGRQTTWELQSIAQLFRGARVHRVELWFRCILRSDADATTELARRAHGVMSDIHSISRIQSLIGPGR